MRYFMTETSRKIARATGRINHVYGARYKWSWLPNEYEQAYVYKYILRNPVRAGICKRVENYSYSSLTTVLKKTNKLPICSQINWKFAKRSQPDILLWLNQPSPKEEQLIRLALRRTTFSFSKDRKIQARVKILDASYL